MTTVTSHLTNEGYNQVDDNIYYCKENGWFATVTGTTVTETSPETTFRFITHYSKM